MDDTPKKAGTAAPSNGPPNVALRRPARAELVWEGKYDAAGRRVAPLRVLLPFQTIETVNESAQDRQKGFQFGPHHCRIDRVYQGRQAARARSNRRDALGRAARHPDRG
jgi:hypothetical protein